MGVLVAVWFFRKPKNLTTIHNTKQSSFLVLPKEVCCCRNQQVQIQKFLWPLLTLASSSPALSHHGPPVHLRQVSLSLQQTDFHLQNRNHCSTIQPDGNIMTVNTLKIPSQVSWSWGEEKGLSRATIQAVASANKALMGWQDMTKKKGIRHHQSHALSQA